MKATKTRKNKTGLLSVGASLIAINSMLAVSPGTIKWSAPLPGAMQIQSSPTLGPDGTLYVAFTTTGQAGALYALNPTTGAVLWNVSNLGNGVVSSPVVNPFRNRIYVCTTDGYIYAIGLSDHKVDASYHLSSAKAILSTPALDYTGSYLYVTAEDGWLYTFAVYSPNAIGLWRSYNIYTGNLDTYNESVPLTTSPAISSDGLVYAIGTDGSESQAPQLYVFTWDGTLLGVQGFSGVTVEPMASIAFGPDGVAYVGDIESVGIHRFSPLDFTDVGPLSDDNEVSATAVIGPDGVIYVGDECGLIHSLNANNTSNWAFQTGGSCFAAAALTADGVLWIVSGDGNLYALDSQSGGQKNTQTYLGPSVTETASSPIVGTDGSVYMVYNTTAFCVAGYGPLSPGLWPTFRMNGQQVADLRYNRWSSGSLANLTLVRIGPFSGGTYSIATGINDSGLVVGYSDSSQYGHPTAFTYDSMTGVLTPVGYQLFLARPSYGMAVDLSRDLVGFDQNGSTHEGFWDPVTGPEADLVAALNANTGYALATVPGIADLYGNKFVVGYSSPSPSPDQATYWTPTLNPFGTDFDSDQTRNSYAWGINGSRKAVGQIQVNGVYHGFFSDPTSNIQLADDLGSAVGSSGSSAAMAINGFNKIAGWTQITTGSITNRPFYKTYDHVNNTISAPWPYTSMDTNLIAGNNGSVFGINVRGQMVGWANVPPSKPRTRPLVGGGGGGFFTNYHAFVWLPGQPAQDLNSLLSPSQQSLWLLIRATGIDDSGRIVGFGLYNGQTNAFLLYPN